VIVGVAKVGLVSKTNLVPEPVELATPVPPLATGKIPVTPVVSGSPMAFVKVPEVGVPSAGVTSVGLVANTLAPVPVVLVVPVPPLPVGRMPVTADVSGMPVTLVIVPEAGVPSTGAVSVGLAMVGEMKWVLLWVKFEPSVHMDIILPAGIVIVVPPVGVMPFLAVALVIVAVYAVVL
jgi:hypothetical protein